MSSENQNSESPALNEAQKTVIAEGQARLQKLYEMAGPAVISDTKNMPGEPVPGNAAPVNSMPFISLIPPGADPFPPEGLTPENMQQRNGGWIGKFAKAALERLKGEHQDELKSYAEEERKEAECAGKFKQLKALLQQFQQNMEMERRKVESFKGIEIPQTLFHQRFEKGWGLEVTLGQPAVLYAFILGSAAPGKNPPQTIGTAYIEHMEAEYGALQSQYRDFVKENRQLLQKLKLI